MKKRNWTNIAICWLKLRSSTVKPWEIGVWTEESALRWAGEGCPVLVYMTDTSALQACYAPALAEMDRLASGG